MEQKAMNRLVGARAPDYVLGAEEPEQVLQAWVVPGGLVLIQGDSEPVFLSAYRG